MRALFLFVHQSRALDFAAEIDLDRRAIRLDQAHNIVAAFSRERCSMRIAKPKDGTSDKVRQDPRGKTRDVHTHNQLPVFTPHSPQYGSFNQQTTWVFRTFGKEHCLPHVGTTATVSPFKHTGLQCRSAAASTPSNNTAPSVEPSKVSHARSG